MPARAGGAHAHRACGPHARHSDRLDRERVADVRLRQRPRRGGRRRGRRDAGADGTRARARARGGPSARQSRRRPPRHTGGERGARSTCRAPARGDPLHENGLTLAREFKLPDLGEGLGEGEVARWLVAEGDVVGEDDPLVEIQTDKATVEIPSPYAGTVLRILVPEGEVAPVGAVLVAVGEPGESLADAGSSAGGGPSGAPSSPGQSAAVERGTPSATTKGVQATPLVRRIAAELGVDLTSVAGTGPQGRITEDDVRAAGAGPAFEGRREKLRGVRRIIAEHMTRAHHEVPAVTWVEECDFEAVSIDRLLATVVNACASTLPEFSELNARLEGDEIVYLDRYDLGVAVQTEQGLVVPVVRDCASRTIDELREDVDRLADAARAGKLAPEELRGSTFTVTSAGKIAGLFQTPIVNHPEVAILSIGRIADRPIVRDGAIVAAKVGYLSLTFDHRVVDGARAAEFGVAVIQRLQQ